MAAQHIRKGHKAIANAIFDPGRFTERKRTVPERGFPELEPLHDWQLRAVVHALDDAGLTFEGKKK